MKLLLLVGVIAVAATSSEVIPANSVIKGVNTFSNKVVKAIVEDDSQNLVCSPLSAHMVLSMITYGARGNTAEVLRSALGLNDNDAITKNGFQTLVDRLTKPEQFELRLANKVFLDATVKPAADFLEITKTTFRSEAQTLNFDNPSAASKVINDWTAVQTKNLIQNIVSKDDLSRDSALVLVNTLYFKGRWKNYFGEGFTRPRPFHINGKIIKDVPTMLNVGYYNYGILSDVNAKFIELPYESDNPLDTISMYVIVPNEVDGLDHLVKNLDKIPVSRLQDRQEVGNFILTLPKFKVESKIDLFEPLSKLGLGEIFSNAADFSGIASAPLKVSQVVQKAFISVDEIGTEAAAATEIEVTDRSGSGSSHRVNFKVDRPFVAMIANNIGVPLFSAVVSEPIF